jgi:hypothetical protein
MCGVASANYLTGPELWMPQVNGNINVSWHADSLIEAAYQWGTDDQCIFGSNGLISNW